MNIPRSATAYSMMVACLKNNDSKALEYALMINMNGTDDQLCNQISDSLVTIARELEAPAYNLFIQIIDALDCITEKNTYILTAQTYLLDVNNVEAVKQHIEKVLNTELVYQATSFEIDLLNELVVASIYIRDNDLLNKVIEKINALGAQL